jgi:type VI secretion system protein ImpA
MHYFGDNMGFFKKFQGPGREAGEFQTVNVIDFDLLLAEITPEHPSGEKDLEYDPAFIELEEKIKGTPEVEIGGKIVQEAKEPNWAEIQSAAGDLLTRTRDLRVAICLIRALVHTEGLIGLRDGLKLLQCFIERFWDTLHPQLVPEDDNDPTQRINILMALCDYETIMAPLKGVTLCSSPKMGVYCLRDIHAATGKLTISKKNDRPVPSMAAIEAAFKDCDANAVRAAAAATADTLLSLSSLEQLLNEKIGSGSALNLGELNHVLEEIDDLLSQQLAKHKDFKSTVPKEKPATQKPAVVKNTPPAQAVSSQGVEPMDTINSRQDVIRILDQICVYYDRNEPASPVPLLLKRARRLVEKNFFEIMQDVAPESAAQIQMLFGGSEEKES